MDRLVDVRALEPLVPREDLAAPPLLRDAPEVELRLVVPDDFERDVPVDFAADLRAPPVDFDPAALLRPPVAGFARELLDRALELRAVFAPPLLEVAPASSSLHLPDITRCAASATASAINVPSLDALETTLVAACDAVSAASSPASRIARRAFGLALIAAAAAANPAAIISRLMPALAILSMVDFFELDEDFFAFAIANLPRVAKKDTSDA